MEQEFATLLSDHFMFLADSCFYALSFFFFTLNSKNHGRHFFFCEWDTNNSESCCHFKKELYVMHGTGIKIFQCFLYLSKHNF
jgi:hypothetical protein